MDVLRRDRVLTQYFCNDVAIIIHKYIIGYIKIDDVKYIKPNTINECETIINHYKREYGGMICSLQTSNLIKYLTTDYGEYPELKKMIDDINIATCEYENLGNSVELTLEINFAGVYLKRTESGEQSYTQEPDVALYFKYKGVSCKNVKRLYNKLNLQNVPYEEFHDFISDIIDNELFWFKR